MGTPKSTDIVSTHSCLSSSLGLGEVGTYEVDGGDTEPDPEVQAYSRRFLRGIGRALGVDARLTVVRAHEAEERNLVTPKTKESA